MNFMLRFKKDFFIKQRFWLLLALVLPFTVSAFYILGTSVSDAIAKERKEIETKVSNIKKPFDQKDFKNQQMIDDIRLRAENLQKKENEVWEIGWKAQEKQLSRWPKEIEDQFNFTNGLFAFEIRWDSTKKALAEMPPDNLAKNLIHGKVLKTATDFVEIEDRNKKVQRFQRCGKTKVTQDQTKPVIFFDLPQNSLVAISFERGKYFGDALTDREQIPTYINSYKSQLHEILAQVDPMTKKGEGVVQLREWLYEKGEDPPPNNRFFQYFSRDFNRDVDFSEDTWILQEDLWIQDEIYRLIRLANDYISKFKGEGGDGNKNYTFTNPYWEFVMSWPGGNKLEITIQNLLNRRQRLDLHVLVQLNKNQPPENILIPGEPLNPRGGDNASRKIVITLAPGTTPTGIYGVEQVLTWETAAVRRIDNICFGPNLGGGNPQGHRVFPEPLKNHLDKKEAAAPAAPVVDPNQPPPQPGVGFPGAKPAMATLSPNGLVRERYTEVTPQLRRMPVAVALIVEQDHVDRVQAAFNNSRMRFLTNQVLLNRYPTSVRPQIVDAKGAPISAGSDDLETNIELVIYGAITIYERYPPRVLTIAPAAPAVGGVDPAKQ